MHERYAQACNRNGFGISLRDLNQILCTVVLLSCPTGTLEQKHCQLEGLVPFTEIRFNYLIFWIRDILGHMSVSIDS